MTTLGDRMVDDEIESLIKITDVPFTHKDVPLPECLPLHDEERRVNHVLLVDLQERRKQQKGFVGNIKKVEWSTLKLVGVFLFLALTGGAGSKLLSKVWEVSQSVWAAIAKS